MDNRYEMAEQNGMSREFADWFFDNKKAGCGNVWFMMMAAMWEGWQGRAAMLQGADGNSPAHSDCCPEQNCIAPAQCGNSPVIPDGLRLALSNAGIAAPESDEMLAATCEKYIQELVTWVKERKPFQPAAPHFLENSKTSTKCWCRTCRPVTFADSRFVVCPECGNKRCPHANDHRNACTGSNEPGQEGSAYPAAPQQEVK